MIIKIGKANDNDYVVNASHVSRRHAQLTRDVDGCLLLIDMDSANGTYVNGSRIEKKRVSQTDTIMLGDRYSLNLPEVLKSRNDYSEEFAALKEIYDKYI